MDFGNRILISNISSIEGWKKYFSVDIFRVYGYVQRLREIYSALRNSHDSIRTKKIVMGVIGKDTIGYWRDIQQVYREFFGIECRGCREAVGRIAMGIPFENVVNEARLLSRDSELIQHLDSLYKLLDRVIDVMGIKGRDRISIENDLNTLLGNPLHIFNIIRGFYSTLINILPLYNEYTMFLEITRSIPIKIYNTFFNGFNLNDLIKMNIAYKRFRVCRDQEYEIVAHETHSIGNQVNLLVNEIYSYIDLSREKLRTKMIKLYDERSIFIENMAKFISKVYEFLGIKCSEKFYSDINRYSYHRFVKGGYSYLELKIRINKETNSVVMGGSRYGCEVFLDMISPYIILGLGWIDPINEKDYFIDGVLHIYLRSNRCE